MHIKANQQLELSNSGKKGWLSKSWNLLTSPKSAMQDIAANPTMLFPLFINAFGYVALALCAFPVFSGPYLKEIAPHLTPDQKTMEIIKILLLSPFQTMFPWILYSGFYLGVIKLLKGEGTFKQVASVTGSSYITIIIWYIISIVAAYPTGILECDTSLSFLFHWFAPNLKGSLFYKFVDSLNVFTVWQFCLIALGLLEVTKLSKTKVYSMVGLSYGIIVFMNTFFS